MFGSRLGGPKLSKRVCHQILDKDLLAEFPRNSDGLALYPVGFTGYISRVATGVFQNA